MTIVYLDMGVIVDAMRNRAEGLNAAINRAKDLGYTFVYSPAHMEEVANIVADHEDKKVGADYAMEHILYIRALTDDVEFLAGRNGIVVTRESPENCLQRVIDGYELTLWAADLERQQQSFRDDRSFKASFPDILQPDETGLMFRQIRERYGINSDKIKSLPPELVFCEKNENILRALKDMAASSLGETQCFPRYEDIRHSHSDLFTTIDFVFRFLEKIGYYPEKINKHRSRMHDVSHAIYSTASDIIVTGDINFRYKIRAVFSLLGVPSQVLDQGGFAKLIIE